MNNTPLPHATHDAPDAALRFDPDAAREHLTRLHEDGPFEIRALRRGPGRVYAGYFDDVEEAVQVIGEKIRQGRARDTKGWYTTLNPINPDLLGRVHNRLEEFPGATTADHDVTGYRHLLLDIDPERPPETSSTDAQLALARAMRDAVQGYLAEEEGWGDPLYAAVTGNGGGLVYRTELLPNDPETQGLVKRCLMALQQQFGTAEVKIDGSVFNPARITKLMGTVARKGDHTPRQPHRTAVAEYPPTPGTVTRAQLERLATGYEPPAQAPSVNGRAPVAGDAPRRAWTIAEVLARSGISYRIKTMAYGAVHVLDRCLTSEAHDDGAVIIEHQNGALSYRCQHNTCAGKRWADAKSALTFPEPRPEAAFGVNSFASERTNSTPVQDRGFNSLASQGAGGGEGDILPDAPPLPSAAAPTDEAMRAAEKGRRLLDAYCDDAGRLAPRSPRALHELFGLGVQMTAIARRAYLQVGAKRVYPSIFGVFVGRSTLTAKTTAEDVLKLAFRASELEHLLFPGRFTAEALMARMGLAVPQDVREGGAEVQARWQQRMRHAAQGLIVRDEVHGLLEDCNRDYNSGLLPLLLEMDGSPERLEAGLTISRGQVEARNICVSLLGATTPAGLRQHAAKEFHWHNGLFGRFALVDEPKLKYAFWDRTASSTAAEVSRGLRAIYTAFPTPQVVFDLTSGDEKTEPRIIGAHHEGYNGGTQATISPDAWAAYAAYDRALWELLHQLHLGERLDPTYGRLPILALRVALTLATAEWATEAARLGPQPEVGLAHWTAAQEITERWRVSAHRILAEATRTAAEDQVKETTDKICRLVQARGGRCKSGDVLRLAHLTTDVLDAAIAASAGRLVVETERTGDRGRPVIWIVLQRPAAVVQSPPAKGPLIEVPLRCEANELILPGENGAGLIRTGAKEIAPVPAWPGAAHPSSVAKVNGHARVLPDGAATGTAAVVAPAVRTAPEAAACGSGGRENGAQTARPSPPSPPARDDGDDGDDDWGGLSIEHGGNATGTAAAVAVAVHTAPGAGTEEEVVTWTG